MLEKGKKRAQLSIIVIVAVVLIAGVLAYFLLREKVSVNDIPAEFVPIYQQYSSCIEDGTRAAISLAGSQGGHIYVDNYDFASDYAPFSSQLNFLGFPVPYWYYVSGNGVIKEQMPKKSEIENEISRYVSDRIRNCDFEQLYSQGFSINFSEPEVKTTIEDAKISVEVDSDVSALKDGSSARKSVHNVEVNSKFGKFYNMAVEIYSKEKNEAFLENYSADVLRLYAPVDGVDLGCSSKVWKTQEVINDLKNGLEANIASLKFKGDYYSLSGSEKKYFIIDKNVDESVNLIYSKSWPTKINVVGDGVDDELMVAKTIGTQSGLGVMGFCYAPYHFVYDVSFPVMIQIYNDEEIFQFPVAVIIDKNMPRKAVFSEINESNEFDICDFKTQDIEVDVYDTALNPLNADISYGCLNQLCRLGSTVNGKLVGKAPTCLNGYIETNAENYTINKYLFSSNSESAASIILDKEHDMGLELSIGGRPVSGTAVVTFTGPATASAYIPEVSNVKLSEGLYNITVYVYGNSSIVIPASTKNQCTEVAQSGIAGFFGGTKEQCFDINIPETRIEYALIGGGTTEEYLLESNLEKGKIKLNVPEFKVPSSLEELQYNYGSFEQSGLDVSYG